LSQTALWSTQAHVVVVKVSLQGVNQKSEKSSDLGQIWDFAEEAKKAHLGPKPIIFFQKVKPHKCPKP